MRDIVKDRLVNTFCRLNSDYGNRFSYEFTYTWFLTCLYHDAAWTIENEPVLDAKNGIAKYFLNEYLKMHDINNNFYNHKWYDKAHYTYSRDLVEKYFYYGLIERKKPDHGILGGFLLYDRLVKNYKNKWNKCKNCNNPNNTYDNFRYEGRRWRIEHLDHFAYIANSIIAHNIWYSSDRELYDRYGLSSLVQSRNNRITLDNEPLLFFLAVLDTIEPTKYFNLVNPKYVWENIQMGYLNGIISIHVLNDTLRFDLWKSKIRSLEDWIDVKVIIDDVNRKAQIKIY